jgi:hypothetical protein
MTSRKMSQVKSFWGSTFVKLKKTNIVPKQRQAPMHTTPVGIFCTSKSRGGQDHAFQI